jgi:uncharacterized protein YecE (DUF72 family)
VEISDTELGIPGDGTIRRWLREAPAGFGFTVLAPKAIAESGFAKTKENKDLVAAIGEVATKLDAHAVVFRTDADFKPTRTNRAALKAFVATIPKKYPRVVLDLPAWTPQQIESTAGERFHVAYDALNDEPPPVGDLDYIRLPGPAGHRSRYDEDALKQLSEHIRESPADIVFCVFRNVDKQTNATALLKMVR